MYAQLFREMDEVNVTRDVVTYNAVLDAVSSQIQLGRKLFQEGTNPESLCVLAHIMLFFLELSSTFI